jgi:hypothetical protein
MVCRLANAGIHVDDLKTRIPNAARADLTGDGLVDVRDIRAFARRHGLSLSPLFERKLERLEIAPASKSDSSVRFSKPTARRR